MTIERARLYSTARVICGSREGQFVKLLTAVPLRPMCDTDRPDAVQFTVRHIDGEQCVYSDAELDRFVF